MLGIQRCNQGNGTTLSPASTSNQTFPSDPAVVIYIQAPPTNVGNVTLRFVNGSTYSGGFLTLTPGSFAPPIGPITNANRLGYQLGNASDSISYGVIS